MRLISERLAGALLGSALAAAACSAGPAGGAHSGAATNPASPAATASSGAELFAVVEPGPTLPDPPGADTAVAIVGLDGVARARATFTPRQVPVTFDTAAVLQPEATVVNGGVLYVDGGGQVRRLTIGGARSDVATFPYAGQQRLSFAASPDGAHLVAVRFSSPPVKSPLPAPGEDIHLPGDYTQDVLGAAAGGQTTVLSHQTFVPSAREVPALAMVGWTSAGPMATTNTGLASQDPPPGAHLWGQLAHLDAAGQPGKVVGGPDCLPWDFLFDDTVLCGSVDFLVVSVRSAGGQSLYTLPNPGRAQYGDLTLAPDGSRFTLMDLRQNRAMVSDRAGHLTALPSGFTAEGWLDAGTVIGVGQGGTMEYVSLDQPTRAVDMGFKGLFVGRVSG
jgi:hypothetical protein